MFTIRFENGTDSLDVAKDDFRAHGHFYFVGIAAACVYAVETVQLGQNLFLQSEFITSTMLSRKATYSLAFPSA